MSKDNSNDDDFQAELFRFYIMAKETKNRYLTYGYLKRLKAEYFCDDGSRTSVLLKILIKKKMLIFDTRRYLYKIKG